MLWKKIELCETFWTTVSGDYCSAAAEEVQDDVMFSVLFILHNITLSKLSVFAVNNANKAWTLLWNLLSFFLNGVTANSQSLLDFNHVDLEAVQPLRLIQIAITSAVYKCLRENLTPPEKKKTYWNNWKWRVGNGRKDDCKNWFVGINSVTLATGR